MSFVHYGACEPASIHPKTFHGGLSHYIDFLKVCSSLLRSACVRVCVRAMCVRQQDINTAKDITDRGTKCSSGRFLQ